MIKDRKVISLYFFEILVAFLSTCNAMSEARLSLRIFN